MSEKEPCVYILASKRNGSLYVGVTSDLFGRMREHVQGLKSDFASRHQIKRLVHHEYFVTMQEAIAREKHLKRRHRAWKIRLIEQHNPEWRDLYCTKSGEISDLANDRVSNQFSPATLW
ncbi:MAG: GIY-YIG nuclease family protein [Pseudomonadota bacterium]